MILAAGTMVFIAVRPVSRSFRLNAQICDAVVLRPETWFLNHLEPLLVLQ